METTRVIKSTEALQGRVNEWLSKALEKIIDIKLSTLYDGMTDHSYD